jgi:hypothetical protein
MIDPFESSPTGDAAPLTATASRLNTENSGCVRVASTSNWRSVRSRVIKITYSQVKS